MDGFGIVLLLVGGFITVLAVADLIGQLIVFPLLDRWAERKMREWDR